MSHKELENGRNFLYSTRDSDPEGDKNYRDNYDFIFRKDPVVVLKDDAWDADGYIHID